MVALVTNNYYTKFRKENKMSAWVTGSSQISERAVSGQSNSTGLLTLHITVRSVSLPSPAISTGIYKEPIKYTGPGKIMKNLNPVSPKAKL